MGSLADADEMATVSLLQFCNVGDLEWRPENFGARIINTTANDSFFPQEDCPVQIANAITIDESTGKVFL